MHTLKNPFDRFLLWSKGDFLNLWSKFATLRIFEEQVAKRYSDKHMRTPTHLGIGQEAISLGVLLEKIDGDTVFSHHRSHNSYLACGGDWRKLVDELHGLTTGCSGGKGGSVHLTDRKVGFVGSSAILGQTAALAVGSALAHKFNKQNNVSFAFFGDAAMEEGATWEALNFAALYELPVVFVCENNRFSTESHLSNRVKPGTSFASKVSSFGVTSISAYGQDIFEVMEKAYESITRVRSRSEPAFLEFQTYRFREHVGPLYDFETPKKFRAKPEQIRDQTHDPKKLLRETLCNSFGIVDETLEATWESVEEEIINYFSSLNMNMNFPTAKDHERDVV